MGLTITQKIMADKAGLETVSPGQIIEMDIDLLLGNDISAPLSIRQIEKIGSPELASPDKVVLVPDHLTPNRDIESAEQCRLIREFVRENNIKNYFEIGRVGIEHALLPELGLTVPGDVIIGGDSHTCTYGALGAFATGVGSTDLAGGMLLGRTWFRVPETVFVKYNDRKNKYLGGKDLILHTIGQLGVDGALGMTLEMAGEAIEALDIEERLTMANMAVECGAINGIMAPDAKTDAFLTGRAKRQGRNYFSDPDARYEKILKIDVSSLEPQVAVPSSPGNVEDVQNCAGERIDQVFIGSCTNGRLSDLRTAAEILRGRKAIPGLRLLVSPATPKIYKQAMDEGLLSIFSDAEASILPPSCGVCCGGHLGILGQDEVCLSTSNRNFKGRMGHTSSRIFLSGPAVAAASAVTGRITHPAEIME